MNITIRAVNQGLWRELKIEAVTKGLTVGEALNQSLEKWLREQKSGSRKEKHKSFWDIGPIAFTDKDVTGLSMKVDEVLYG